MRSFDSVNIFDAATVVMIVIGALISCSIFYLSLPQPWQATVESSVSFLDFHEQWQQQTKTFAFMTNTVSDFYGRFYVAFTQIASADPELLPELAWTKTFDALGTLADGIGRNYRQPQPVYSFHRVPGDVLGIYLETKINH